MFFTALGNMIIMFFTDLGNMIFCGVGLTPPLVPSSGPLGSGSLGLFIQVP
jgi:hypothetical protein